jgi:hypothetical protein
MTLDDEDIERIATRLAKLLQEHTTDAARYVDAAFVARTLEVDRDWVYAHARELGGVRLGGDRGRLRFDLARIRRDLACPAGAKSRPATARRPRRQPPTRRHGDVELIPYDEVRCTGNIGGRAAQQRHPTRYTGNDEKEGPDALTQ